MVQSKPAIERQDETNLDKILQLIHAQAQFSHGRFEHFPQSILLHEFNDDSKRFFFGHLKPRRINGLDAIKVDQTFAPMRPQMQTKTKQ